MAPVKVQGPIANRQLVTVQRITVTEGGQAVVAGNVTTARQQGNAGQ